MTTINDRITALKEEQLALTTRHDAMVAENQKANTEFQQVVSKNQVRFQQITGAIQELEALKKLFEEDGKEKATQKT